MKTLSRWGAVGLWLVVSLGQAEPLPEPLTLDYALSLADEFHPDLAVAQAGIDQARAERGLAAAQTGLTATIEARARWVDPPEVANDPRRADHRAALVLRKPLYDFGRSSHLHGAAEAEVERSRHLWLERRQQRRLDIMRHFFDVLLADLEYTYDNEAMTMAFLRFDRARDRMELGQVAEYEVRALEAEFERLLHRRSESQSRQRLARVALAHALNRPDHPPAALAMPALESITRSRPELEPLIEQALTQNPRLAALQAGVDAARQRVAAAEAGLRPRLVGEAEALSWHRNMGGHDNWRAGVLLEIPLLDGGANRAGISRARAELMQAQAELDHLRMALRRDITETWFLLRDLEVQQRGLTTALDARELQLDRSRALYEMEVQADIGDSMVRLTESQWRQVANRFDRALAWARLDALTGAMPGQAREE